jgi:general secretion pathway protein C
MANCFHVAVTNPSLDKTQSPLSAAINCSIGHARLDLYHQAPSAASTLLVSVRMQLALRRYFWTIYVALVCASGLIASQIARLLLEPHPPIIWKETQTAKPVQRLDGAALDTPRLTSLIGLRPSPVEETLSRTSEDSGPARSGLAVKLIGTLSGVARRWVVASLDVRGKAHSYAIGDEIEGASIIDIERNRVIVWNQSRQEFIDRGAPTEAIRSEAIPGIPPRQGIGAGIRALSPTEYEVPRPELDNILSDIDTIATQARSVPVIKEGRMQGLRLFGIRPESVYQRLGISNGDVITRINGEQLDSMSKGVQLFARLRDTSRIDVEFERNGTPTRKSYYFR